MTTGNMSLLTCFISRVERGDIPVLGKSRIGKESYVNKCKGMLTGTS